MTRHKWEELKAKHLDTPERRKAYAEARERLEAEIAAYKLTGRDLDAGLTQVKNRALAEHDEQS